jgi:hypothetical protein
MTVPRSDGRPIIYISYSPGDEEVQEVIASDGWHRQSPSDPEGAVAGARIVAKGKL